MSVRYGQPLYPAQRVLCIFSDEISCPNGNKALVIETDGDFFRWRYCDGSEYFISADGRQIWINYPPGKNEQTLTYYLIGPILGFVLRLRGQVCLHASVVCIDGAAVAFMGYSGVGKSTFAAALAKYDNCSALSDDLAVLSVRHDTFFVAPGYARLRLWPDASKILYGEAAALPRLIDQCELWPEWDKQYRVLKPQDREFETSPQPLAAVYALDDRAASATSIETLSGRKAVLSLLTNVYQGYLSDAQRSACELTLLSHLAQQVPIRLIHRTDAIEHLPALCKLVMHDFKTAKNSAALNIA